MIRRIAVLTGGDEAPGMNAAIRAVTRTGLSHGWEVIGVRQGYAGLVDGNFIPFTARDVGGIMQRGGSVSGCGDGNAFHSDDDRRSALARLEQRGIDALIVIGGEDAQTEAWALAQMGFPVNGIAASIENDVPGTDITIGVDTAINVALNTIDRLKITTLAENHTFLVEVAGRKCGYLALMTGMAGGAEAIVIPEVEITLEEIVNAIQVSRERGKSHTIIIVAEGAAYSTDLLAQYLAGFDPAGYQPQKTTLGHIQRSSPPDAFDRILGTQLGACAVDALARGEAGVLAAYLNGVCTRPLAAIAGKTRQINLEHIALSERLAL